MDVSRPLWLTWSVLDGWLIHLNRPAWDRTRLRWRSEDEHMRYLWLGNKYHGLGFVQPRVPSCWKVRLNICDWSEPKIAPGYE